MVSLIILILLVSQPTPFDRLTAGLFDDTFSGIYRLSAFDWCLLGPYFGILIILSIYGIHRYETILRYRKYRKNLLTSPPQLFEHLPRVTIQLPLFNERFVVERLLEKSAKSITRANSCRSRS